MVRHILQLGVSHFSRIASNVLVFVILARLWGPEIFGQFAYWFAVANLIALVSDLGAANYLLSVIGSDHHRSRSAFYGVLKIRGGVALTTFLVATIYVLVWLDQIASGVLFLVLLVSAMAAATCELCFVPLRAFGRYSGEMRDTTISGFITVILVLGAGYCYPAMPWPAALALLISRLVSLALAAKRVYSENDVLSEDSGCVFSVRAKELLPFACDSALTNMSSNIDTILMKSIFGIGAVGVYQAGARLLQGGLTFAPVLAGVYLPKLAASLGIHKDFRTANGLSSNLRSRMSLLGFALGLVFALAGGGIVHLVFGSRYASLTNLMPWFGVALYFRYVAAGFGVSLTATGSQWARLFGNVFSISILVGASYLFAPHLGEISVAVGLVCSNVFLALFYSRIQALFRPEIGNRKVGALELLAGSVLVAILALK